MNPMSLLTMSPEMLREASHRESEHRAATRLARQRRVASAFLWIGATGGVVAAIIAHAFRR